MKNYQVFHASILFSAIAFISGCSTTSVQPVSTGQIVGTVELHEMDCSASTSSAGVTVQILGTKFTAVSDSSGTFKFDDIPGGYYSFQFSKPGFTTYVQSSVPFIGSGTLEEYVNGQLIRINDWKTTLSPPTISKFAAYPPPDSGFLFNFPSGFANVLDSSGNFVDFRSGGYIILYFSKSPAINYMDTGTYFTTSEATTSGNNNVYLFPKYVHDGDTVYFVGYPLSNCYAGQNQYTYYVGDTLKTGYAGYGPPSNTGKVVLP